MNETTPADRDLILALEYAAGQITACRRRLENLIRAHPARLGDDWNIRALPDALMFHAETLIERAEKLRKNGLMKRDGTPAVQGDPQTAR